MLELKRGLITENYNVIINRSFCLVFASFIALNILSHSRNIFSICPLLEHSIDIFLVHKMGDQAERAARRAAS